MIRNWLVALVAAVVVVGLAIAFISPSAGDALVTSWPMWLIGGIMVVRWGWLNRAGQVRSTVRIPVEPDRRR